MLGVFLLAPLALSDFIKSAREDLHDMKPVDGDLGFGQVLFHALEEGRRHIADHFLSGLRNALMGSQKLAEGLDGGLTTAGYSEDNWLALALHIQKYGDVVMAALGGGFIKPHGINLREVKLVEHALDIVMHDTP